MSDTVNKSDVQYFGQFTEGYNPYSAGDLDLVVGTLVGLLHASTAARRPLRFLEVGCASGQFSSELSARLPDNAALEYYGLDIAEPVLKRYPFNKVCGSAFAMPLQPHSMDIVCCPASLHHLAPFGQALAEIDRVLAPGGLFYCIEPNFYHPHRRWFMRFPALYRRYRDANDVPIRPDWLEAQLRQRGYRTEMNRLINLEFRSPGVLQKGQNTLAALPWPRVLHRWIYPWFILAVRKPSAAG